MMSDTAPERNSNSKSNLIEVQHVGVTAKLQSPLINFLQSSSSSTEAENANFGSKSKYNKFNNDTQVDETEDVTATDSSKVLYEMRYKNGMGKITPSKIEFQLYQRRAKRLQRNKSKHVSHATRHKTAKRKLYSNERHVRHKEHETPASESTLFQRLRQSLDGMRTSKANVDKLLGDLPEPTTATTAGAAFPQDTHIGIYHFEHGCADYLRTTDCHPQLLSLVLAERATRYATHFWAEFFGTIHIGVAFIVTFVLQCYRFALYSLVNTLLVGILHMTSDYLVKPVLTVVFNGFLQPPLIFIYNILSSVRDLLEPVADAINNFMKPIATVAKSLRLIHVSYNNRKLAKDV